MKITRLLLLFLLSQNTNTSALTDYGYAATVALASVFFTSATAWSIKTTVKIKKIIQQPQQGDLVAVYTEYKELYIKSILANIVFGVATTSSFLHLHDILFC